MASRGARCEAGATNVHRRFQQKGRFLHRYERIFLQKERFLNRYERQFRQKILTTPTSHSSFSSHAVIQKKRGINTMRAFRNALLIFLPLLLAAVLFMYIKEYNETHLPLCAPLGQKTPIFPDKSANIGLFFPCEPGFAVTRSYLRRPLDALYLRYTASAPINQAANRLLLTRLFLCAGGFQAQTKSCLCAVQ